MEVEQDPASLVAKQTAAEFKQDDDKNNFIPAIIQLEMSENAAKDTTTTSSSFLTRTAAFARLSHWAFTVCDGDSTGKIGKEELYAGVLLVHINLAKYAGAAACYPPTRKVVDHLFVAADKDHSGSIEEEEFTEIMRICSVDIASRIVVYYSFLILLVPYLADGIVHVIFQLDDWMGWELRLLQDSESLKWVESVISWKDLTDRILSLTLFFFVIPTLFNAIDSKAKNRAEKSD